MKNSFLLIKILPTSLPPHLPTNQVLGQRNGPADSGGLEIIPLIQGNFAMGGIWGNKLFVFYSIFEKF
ncbi:hypothetical protein L8106_00135 [Lyngbya sp. PCC 8106]|nr:hypothetical protein L8106_00135 [Lyngbya sp. PCC 8106]